MPKAKLGLNGGLGNRMIQYIYGRALQAMTPGCQLCGYDIPPYKLVSPDCELEGRVLHIDNGHRHSLSTLSYVLAQGVYDSLQFRAYVQRLEYFPDRAACAAYFPTDFVVDRSHLGPGKLTINIRGAEVLGALHPDYNPAPVSFFEHVAQTTKLEPVIMGQLGDDPYSHEIRARFAGCVFLPHRSALEDFEIVRHSTHVAMSVSTFSWLAAWLSPSVETIHMPLLGLLNPRQRPDIDLAPTRDERYRFYEFPVARWAATPQQVHDLLAARAPFSSVTPAQVRAMMV